MTSSTAYHGFLHLVLMNKRIHICTDCCMNMANNNKVEETMVCTTVVDDVIHRHFERALSLLINIERGILVFGWNLFLPTTTIKTRFCV